MIEWALIVAIYGGDWQTSPVVLDGYISRRACEAAGEQTKRVWKDAKTACVISPGNGMTELDALHLLDSQ